MPGFIDTHIHMPQTQVIASWGAQLLDWLNTYTFPAEAKFADPAHAAAHRRAPSSTSCCATAPPPRSPTARCIRPRRRPTSRAAEARNLRMIGGKVMMDRNAPEGVPTRAQSSYDDTQGADRALARARARRSTRSRRASPSPRRRRRWRWRRRWSAEHPDCYVQTHLSENRDEIDFTALALSRGARLSRRLRDATGCSGRRACSATAIHLSERETRGDGGDRVGGGLLPDLEPLPRQRALRRGRARASRACAGRSPPTSAAAPTTRCCARWTRATRCWRCAGRSSTRSRPSGGSPAATPRRSGSRTRSARWRRARRPTSSCSTARATPAMALRHGDGADAGGGAFRAADARRRPGRGRDLRRRRALGRGRCGVAGAVHQRGFLAYGIHMESVWLSYGR